MIATQSSATLRKRVRGRRSTWTRKSSALPVDLLTFPKAVVWSDCWNSRTCYPADSLHRSLRGVSGQDSYLACFARRPDVAHRARPRVDVTTSLQVRFRSRRAGGDPWLFGSPPSASARHCLRRRFDNVGNLVGLRGENCVARLDLGHHAAGALRHLAFQFRID